MLAQKRKIEWQFSAGEASPLLTRRLAAHEEELKELVWRNFKEALPGLFAFGAGNSDPGKKKKEEKKEKNQIRVG